ncbi:uncharacterized protein LOC132938928 [Metopolophium dirhodum]|uniref:uncharacterized protein LOC132938928 n=1 Tax=Metopolophium dirhodum TaxID=44670 RepID=UPI0029905E00|nr:uncharacterized protein LOC132938928 [Metopolophium dirhodum]
MAFSILESDRIDRYEFEIFIGQINFTGFNEEAENCNANNQNVLDESGSKKEEVSSQKYTIKAVLDNIFQLNISNYDKTEEDPEDQCLTYYDDFESNESLTDIVKQLTERYSVNEKPSCNAQNICFDITYKESDKAAISIKSTINRGVICIFACVPRTLITILQKNPLELMICEDLQDSQIQLGTVSFMLSSSLGFTGAICNHFYEKGYDPYAHTVENVYDVKNMDGSQTIGDMFVRLKLTCHGPETMQVNQIVLKSDQPELQPIFNDSDSFDFHFDKHIIQSPPTMMYDSINKCVGKIQVFNPETRDLLDCQRNQEVKENKPCVCPCKGLIGNVQKVLLDGTKRFHASMCKSNLEVNQACSSVKTCGSVHSAKVENCNDCTEKKSR